MNNISQSFLSRVNLPQFPLWDKMGSKRNLVSFDLEITARCNNNCRHCYINLPSQDEAARKGEIPLTEIKGMIDQAVSLGALWCLVTGGEPLLREDFFDIYLYLKKKGLLITVFTNATLVNKEHIRFFKKYPPRDIEVSVYGVTSKVYESVTRGKGSFSAFMRGLNLLLKSGIKVRFKAMALRSNVDELPRIADFCRDKTKDYFRFDPLLHLRFDGNSVRNKEIRSERLSAEEIIACEKADPQRFQALVNNCDKFIIPELADTACDHLFRCGIGNGELIVSPNGLIRLCSSLYCPDFLFDLRSYTLKEIWEELIPQVLKRRSSRKELKEKCLICPIINLCMWCPAHAYLETKELDSPVEYFCRVAKAREAMLTDALK
ncbi:MAG TPA: hypothetical protein DCL49_05940 [Candidatus Omnitrophica bacterium]|nr:hypothetical protein [Candidatus Omnitrophota bacterium]